VTVRPFESLDNSRWCLSLGLALRLLCSRRTAERLDAPILAASSLRGSLGDGFWFAVDFAAGLDSGESLRDFWAGRFCWCVFVLPFEILLGTCGFEPAGERRSTGWEESGKKKLHRSVRSFLVGMRSGARKGIVPRDSLVALGQSPSRARTFVRDRGGHGDPPLEGSPTARADLSQRR
jgi:hypothetical protein